MENISSMLFAIQFLIAIGIIIYKFYNVMSFGEEYDIKVSFVFFISFMLCWLVGLMVTLFNPEELILSQILKIENILFWLNTIFFIMEFIFFLGRSAKSTSGQARNSLQAIERSFK